MSSKKEEEKEMEKGRSSWVWPGGVGFMDSSLGYIILIESIPPDGSHRAPGSKAP